jgi:hypothetical protein
MDNDAHALVDCVQYELKARTGMAMIVLELNVAFALVGPNLNECFE